MNFDNTGSHWELDIPRAQKQVAVESEDISPFDKMAGSLKDTGSLGHKAIHHSFCLVFCTLADIYDSDIN